MGKTIIYIALGLVAILVSLYFYTSQRTSTVVAERDFNAPVATVWQIWIDPVAMKEWWSPEHYTAPVIKNDFRLGGTFLFSMKAPDGKISWNTGKYTEIVPLKKIVSRMSFADESGKPIPAAQVGIPGKWPDELTVTVEFSESNGKTHVKVTEEGIPMVMSVFAKMGWSQQFDKFERLLK